MPNRFSDPLFQLIHSLQKSEKRNFKLYIKRNSANEDLKIIQLFDAMDKMSSYDEAILLKKLPNIKKQQISNIKAHLYKQLLVSLRLLSSDENIDIQLHEQLDFARILYNKGLYLQSLKILEKLKELANAFHQDSFLIQIISLEKKIETLHITRSLQDRAERLTIEAEDVNEKRRKITQLSNLALQLYSWYIKHGHAHNKMDEIEIKRFFNENIPKDAHVHTGFYEKLYLHQCYCWYAFVRQDFLMYYRHTQKWVDLFRSQPQMISVEAGHYIKGLHNLLNAHFDLRNYIQFQYVLKEFEEFSKSAAGIENENNRIQTFIYLTTGKINRHFMLGSFKEGLLMVPFIEEKLKEYALYLDSHQVLVFYYKIASLYFGSGKFSLAIDYLQKIINWKVELRDDLQCYSRLMHLLAHYELGNFDILDHLIRSVYRYMSKMKKLTIIEEEIFRFLGRSLHFSSRVLHLEFEKLLCRIKKFEKNRYETRSFAYLDIISWLEGKAYNKSMSEIIKDKYLSSNKRRLIPRENS